MLLISGKAALFTRSGQLKNRKNKAVLYMRVEIRLSVLFFFLLVSYLSWGQDFFANTRKIGTEDGLSHYKVLAFYPEREGMWIGTNDGLDFYDGHLWTYWKKEDGQLNIETVNYIYKDQQDLLWLFAAESIERTREIQSIDILNQERDSVLSFEEYFGQEAPFELKEVQCFFDDQQRRMYFFARDQLWQYASNNQFQLISLPPGFSPYAVFKDGTYVGKLAGKLVVVSATDQLIYTLDYDLKEEYLTIMGTSQKFWVSYFNGSILGFEKLANGTYEEVKFPRLNKENRDSKLKYFDSAQKQLWVGKGSFLYLLDDQEQVLYQHKIRPNLISKDYNGNIWISKREIDIIQIQKKKFNRYLYDPEEYATYRCRGITEKDGQLYVNTYKGIRTIDLASKEVQSSIKLKRTFVFLKKRDGQILLSNWKVFQLDEADNPKAIIDEKERIPHRVWALFEDRNDRIWIGNQGLSYLEDGRIKSFEQYNAFEALKKAIVLFFFKDKNGVIWLGSNKGLYQLDLEKGIIAAYGKNKQGAFRLPSNKFQHMHQDAQGIYWLATEDVGLIRWNKANGNIACFGKPEGLLSNNVYAVYEDDFENLWMSTFKGLVQFQKKSKRINVFTEEEGITNNEFNRIAHYQSEDGQIYFGGQNGITAFHPKDFLEFKTNQDAFKLSVQHVSVFGSNILKDTLSDGSKIDLANLNPGTRVIDFEIKGSDLFWTDRIDLHYTLQSIGNYKKALPTYKEKISADNHIELFGMHPDAYNLEIRAVQKNGKQLGETLLLKLKIAQPFFQKPLFWILVVLAILMIIWGYIKFKTTRFRKRQIELEVLVTERTNQILKNKKLIQDQAEQIDSMKDQLNQKDERWLEQFREIINERLEDPELYLPDIIEGMDISRTAFYEKVKVLTRMTPNQYIQEVRLMRAKAILDEGKVKTIKEVAHAIGMKRPGYFSKLFKERFGVTPSAYFRDLSN